MQSESGGVSTILNEVLENTRELWVLVDVEKVREGLRHLPLLEETWRGPRAHKLREEQHSCPIHFRPKPFVYASCQIAQ